MAVNQMRFLAWVFSAAALTGGISFPIALALRGGEFLSIPRIILFGCLPVCGAAVAFVAILKGNVARQLFLAYGLALIVAVFGAEVYLFLNKYVFTVESAAAPESPNHPDGIRAQPQLCGEHLGLMNPPIRLGDKPVQPVSGLANNLLNPEADRPTWRFTDQYGFNNPPDQWQERSLIVVGDSYAFGADVPIGQGFVDRLRQRLGHVVNLGCNGNGPLLELASLVEYGPIVHPRVVVWAYSEGTDLHRDLPEELSSPILPRYLSADFKQDLAANREQLNRAIANYLDRCLRDVDKWHCPITSHENILSTVLSTGLLSLNELRSSLGLGHRLDPRLVGIFEQVLRRAKAVVSEWGGQLVFVYLPEKSRYVSALGQWDAGPYAEQVIGVAKRLGLDVINIDSVFRKQPNPAALNKRVHYSAQGYALVGDTIADALVRSR
jgi:hypothetical protein